MCATSQRKEKARTRLPRSHQQQRHPGPPATLTLSPARTTPAPAWWPPSGRGRS